MNARRIVVFCAQFRPVLGGAERQAERQARALVALGHQVEIWTPRIDPESPERETAAGVVVHRFPLYDLATRFPVRGIAVANLPNVAVQIAHALWTPLGRADVLHCHIGSLATVVAGRVARARGVPSVCKAAIAGDRSDIGETSRGGPVNRLVGALMPESFDRWIATTPAVRDELVRGGVRSGAIELLPNGVETKVAVHETGGPIRRFLYLGRLSSNIRRDVPTLVRAFAKLVAREPNVELAVVGGGDLFDETRRVVRDVGLDGRVQMPGETVAEPWLIWADAFVLPSRNEGLSNALLEAMAHGLPCIANDIGPNRAALDEGRCGVLVPLGNVDALVDAMHGFTRDSVAAHRLGAAARRRVEQDYSISAVGDRLSMLYESLLRARARGEGT